MTNEPITAAATLDDLLTSTQQMLAVLRSQAVEPADGDAVALLRAEGTAADGQVTATVVQGGRLASLTVDEDLLGQGAEALCGHVVRAVNAALTELDERVSESARADVDALAARLGGVREPSARQMAMFSQAMDDVAARLHRDR
ncbi:YbaB/EbfC family nucleoid-associated protein [Micromonospora sp. R77]|uniref:YbaB/EbfC family nucleoid-associated protein n=1 Tax=Micromonospora sp. R77 TaxID=2925836 RepID=UPI001F6190C5|nr:YbaB/EbfC family nucleoid-associated protein [Micromonospora sp. R77]MCI4065970.1 YbaB/EbfC family nucleoid-associated protein [Micromonospora sp. R77]